jgi:DNA-binding MarR family transcriptional regulator
MLMNLQPTTTTPNPHNYPGFLIWIASNKWEKQVNKTLSNHGLNHGEILHLISLCFLLDNTKEVTQARLAEFTGTTTMGVSKILNKLEESDIIKRQIGTDPRSNSLSITKAGKEILMDTASILAETDSTFFDLPNKASFINQLTQLIK